MGSDSVLHIYGKCKSNIPPIMFSCLYFFQAFDDRLFVQNSQTQKAFPDKKKKEGFKALVLGIIGVSLSTMSKLQQ